MSKLTDFVYYAYCKHKYARHILSVMLDELSGYGKGWLEHLGNPELWCTFQDQRVRVLSIAEDHRLNLSNGHIAQYSEVHSWGRAEDQIEPVED